MEFLLIVTLLVLALGIGSAILPFVAFRGKLTRPLHARVRRSGRALWKTDRHKTR
jgi:hypothetical protein